MKVAIIGYGHVGKAMHNLFKDAMIYDIKQMEGIKFASKQEINDCDAAFICVTTPNINLWIICYLDNNGVWKYSEFIIWFSTLYNLFILILVDSALVIQLGWK